MVTIEKLIQDYQEERQFLEDLKAQGETDVDFDTWDFRSQKQVEEDELNGVEYDAEVTIDVAISIIDKSIAEMQLPNANPEDFNY